MCVRVYWDQALPPGRAWPSRSSPVDCAGGPGAGSAGRELVDDVRVEEASLQVPWYWFECCPGAVGAWDIRIARVLE
jgi:hypothetical protein